jgi:hypothetical protein
MVNKKFVSWAKYAANYGILLLISEYNFSFLPSDSGFVHYAVLLYLQQVKIL